MSAFRILGFVVALLLGATRALAPPHADELYAQALRAFNPALDGRTSLVFADRVISEADSQGLDARLLVALIAVESSWHPQAVSSAGALGLGQLMPSTAAGLSVDPHDAQQNIRAVAIHLRSLLDRYSRYDIQTRYELTLSAYNAGAGAVEKYGGVPPYAQTRNYVRSVISLWRRLAGAR
ncbi:MAG: lytic transglycosylase domain-containing protein [Candidatus Baltobacteraceae bacterium]